MSRIFLCGGLGLAIGYLWDFFENSTSKKPKVIDLTDQVIQNEVDQQYPGISPLSTNGSYDEFVGNHESNYKDEYNPKEKQKMESFLKNKKQPQNKEQPVLKHVKIES